MRPGRQEGGTSGDASCLPFCRRTAEGLRLRVRVQPRSSRDRVAGILADEVKVAVTAPPVDGAANDAVVDTLADWLGVARRSVSVVQGASSRSKVVEIRTDDPEGVIGRICSRLPDEGGRPLR